MRLIPSVLVFFVSAAACNEQNFAGGKKSDKPAQSQSPIRVAPAPQSICSQQGAINIVMVFDNSQSQTTQDLISMRQGATQMVQNLAQYSSAAGEFKVNVASVSFNTISVIAGNGWVEINAGGGMATAIADIEASTTVRARSTIYSQALNRVQELYSSKVTSGQTQEFVRNYVVFLSDGEPSTRDRPNIMPLTSQIADQHAAAFVTIGTGGTDFISLKQMASVRGVSFPDGHQSVFRHAAAQSDVARVFDEVFQSFQSICPKS